MISQFAHQVVDLLLGTDIDAAGGFIKNQDVDSVARVFGAPHFARLPPLRLITCCSKLGVLISIRSLYVFATSFSVLVSTIPYFDSLRMIAKLIFHPTAISRKRPFPFLSSVKRPMPCWIASRGECFP